ncbi:MAG: UDP-N-acetylmuramate dehydrogenase [Synergistaceae bacterium]|nr:UDP-N-acetylmuramate dehydrogenase [Synergistaceae bacterium]
MRDTEKNNFPLSALSTLGTGGRAEFFTQPDSISELQKILKAAKNLPVYVIGGGSNIVIPDGKINGLTVCTRSLNFIDWQNNSTAEIGAGFPLPLLLKTLTERNLGGLEFAVGIPGTLGGAVSGNAGAGGHGVCEFVDAVKAVDSSGEIRTFKRGEFEYGYRYCSLKGVIIVSLTMTFRKAQDDDADKREEFLSKRKNQPLESRSAGCTFKNPEGISAGKLLDECGCKGLTVGNAKVSEKHANFLIISNNNEITASSDILNLAELCREIVFERTGICLQLEIKILAPCFFV